MGEMTVATEGKPSRRLQFALRDLLLIVLACAVWVAILPPCLTLRSFDDRFDSTFRYPLLACAIALGVVLFSGTLSLALTTSPKIDAGARSWWLALALVLGPLLCLVLFYHGGHGDTAAYFTSLRLEGLVMSQERYRMDHGEYSPSFGNLDPYIPSMESPFSRAEGLPGQAGVRPIEGYVFRILKAQGSHAQGGRKSYITTDKDGKDRMTEGFAIIAIPVSGERGITFMVAQSGKSICLVGRALGPNAAQIANLITEFDPDESWIEVRR